mgnify:CR=1 FL=1
MKKAHARLEQRLLAARLALRAAKGASPKGREEVEGAEGTLASLPDRMVAVEAEGSNAARDRASGV